MVYNIGQLFVSFMLFIVLFQQVTVYPALIASILYLLVAYFAPSLFDLETVDEQEKKEETSYEDIYENDDIIEKELQ